MSGRPRGARRSLFGRIARVALRGAATVRARLVPWSIRFDDGCGLGEVLRPDPAGDADRSIPRR